MFNRDMRKFDTVNRNVLEQHKIENMRHTHYYYYYY